MTLLTKKWHIGGRMAAKRGLYDPNDKLAPDRDKSPDRTSEDSQADAVLEWLREDAFEPDE